jgi:hypothetical protein
MDDEAAVEVALQYVEYLRTGDDVILATAFTPDHLDHVSGQRGVEIMRTVRGWLDASSPRAVRDDLGVLRQLDAPEQLPIERDRPTFRA